MNSPFVLDGDDVMFETQFGDAAVKVRPGTIQASQAAFKIGNKAVCVLGDERSVEVTDCIYMTPKYPQPGKGTLTIEALGPDQQSRRASSGGQHTLLKGTRMKARFTVTAQAKGPPPANDPDTTEAYSGAAQFSTTQSAAAAESEAVLRGTTHSAGSASGSAPPAQATDAGKGDTSRTGDPVEFGIKIQDRFGPAADEPFVLTIGGVAGKITGRTDSQGVVSAQIPRSARRGRLEVGEDLSRISFSLEFNDLPSVDTAAGQKRRLLHLGFASAATAGANAQYLIAAARAFQKAHGLPVDGEMNEASRSALLRAHGC